MKTFQQLHEGNAPVTGTRVREVQAAVYDAMATLQAIEKRIARDSDMVHSIVSHGHHEDAAYERLAAIDRVENSIRTAVKTLSVLHGHLMLPNSDVHKAFSG